jgi:hypothetical protein
MKSKVLDRPMFRKGEDPENTGIMQGFKDSLAEDDSGYDSGKMLSRTPRSPEILMNNLRGDMRSVDERVKELIDLVGEDAAMQTPPEVLTLLQPILKEQQAAGIAGLQPPPGGPAGAPPGMPPMPPPGAGPMPPGMPPGMPPMPPPGPEAMGLGALPTAQGPEGAPPMQMAAGGYVQRFANGGYVQNFKDGSGPGGVTPPTMPGAMALDNQTLRAMATADFLRRQAGRTKIPEPALEDEFARRQKVYQNLIGQDDESAKKDKYWALTEAFLNLASNTDPTTGKPMRGGLLSKVGGAFKGTPSRIAAIDEARRKQDVGIKMAAIESAERYLDSVRKQNIEAVQGSLKDYYTLAGINKRAKEAEKEGEDSLPTDKNIEWLAKRATAYADGSLPPEDAKTFEGAAAILMQPTLTTYTSRDPVTGELVPMTTTSSGLRLPWLNDSLQARGRLSNAVETAGVTPPGLYVTPPPDLTGEAPASEEDVTMAEGGQEPERLPPPTSTEAKAPPLPVPAVWDMDPLQKELPYSSYYSTERESMYNAASGTGPMSKLYATWFGLPILGEIAPEDAKKAQEMRDFLTNRARDIVRGFQQNPRYAEGERKAIVSDLNLEPAFFDRPGAYKTHLITLDQTLKGLQENDLRDLENKNLDLQTQRNTLASLKTLHDARIYLGAPLSIKGADDPLLYTLPMGSMFYDQSANRVRQKVPASE